MKTIRKADGLHVEEPCNAADVAYAGLAALVEYFDNTAPTGPYLMRAFRMREAYCSMLERIAMEEGTVRYLELMLEALDRIVAESKKKGTGDGREAAAQNPQG